MILLMKIYHPGRFLCALLQCTRVYTYIKLRYKQYGGDWQRSVGQNHFHYQRERVRLVRDGEFRVFRIFRDTNGFRLTGCCHYSVTITGREQYPVFQSASAVIVGRVPSQSHRLNALGLDLTSRQSPLFYSYFEARVTFLYLLLYYKNIICYLN